MANRLDAPDFGCALQVSGDRGRSWITADPVPQLPAGADKCYAPEVAFEADGTLHYLFVGLAGRGNEPMGAFLTESKDRGRTFSAPRQTLGPLNFAVRMAIDTSSGDRGRMHLVWVHASSDPPLGGFGPPPNPILAAYSDDGGARFSEPVQVSDPNRERVVAPALALGPNHSVQVAYYDLGADAVDYQGLEGGTWDGRWSLVVAGSRDGGRHFETRGVVDDAIVPDGRVMLVFTMPPPALVVGPASRTCVAWTDARGGDSDAVLRCSADGGRRWGELRRLNDDTRGNGAAQYMPRLVMAPGGRLYAAFYDRRDSPDGVAANVYFTYSADGDTSFAPNVRLTSDPSSTQVGQRYANASAVGLVEFGSRIGLLADGGGAVAAWADTRNQARGTAQDIFATRIVLAGGGDTGGSGRGGWFVAVTGVVAVGIGVLAAVGAARRRARQHPDPAGDEAAR